MITLTIEANVIELPPGLVWEDEFAWAPVAQKAEVTVAGALVVQEGVQLAGRPITLIGGEDACWIARSDLEALYAAMQTAGRTMILTLHDSRTFMVMWRRNPQPIEAKQLFRMEEPTAATFYVIETLKFIEVGS